jgi:hypothetical protein
VCVCVCVVYVCRDPSSLKDALASASKSAVSSDESSSEPERAPGRQGRSSLGDTQQIDPSDSRRAAASNSGTKRRCSTGMEAEDDENEDKQEQKKRAVTYSRNPGVSALLGGADDGDERKVEAEDKAATARAAGEEDTKEEGDEEQKEQKEQQEQQQKAAEDQRRRIRRPVAVYDPVQEAARPQHMTDDAYNTEGSSSAEDDSDDAYARQDGADSRSDQQWLMSLEVGSNVDAKDRDKWYAANVVGTSDKLVKVHYIGFGQRYDRWLERDTKFIRRRSKHHSIAKDSWGRPIFVAPSSSESTRSHRSTTPGTDQLSRTAELSQRVSKSDSVSNSSLWSLEDDQYSTLQSTGRLGGGMIVLGS